MRGEMTLGNGSGGEACAQVLACVDVSIANSGVVTEEYKRERCRLILCWGYLTCYNVNIWTLCS